MVTYKNKQGKQVKGKVIHRHDGKDASHLTGHVNIQKIGGVPSFPVTVHVSDIKPHITEETDMQNENVYTMIDSIQTGDTDRVETLFREIMNTKISDVLASNKEEVAKSMFNTNECAECEAEEVDEALVGNQHKIDANKNGKVDGHDFKLLRKKKGVKEEVAQVEEEEMEEAAKWRNNPNAHYTSKSGKKVALGDYKHNFSSLQKRKPATFDKGKVTKKHAENLKDRIKHGFSYDRDGVKIGEEVQVDENTFEQGGKMKTDTKPRHVSPHFKYLKKRSYDEIRADALKNAGLTDVSKKSPAVKKEEVEYVDEGNDENKKKKPVTNLDVVSRQLGKPLIVKGMPPQHILDRLKRKNSNLTDAYSDPYAAKKSAEMKKAHAATMADAKKEYDAARKPKFAKNFMKMKNETTEFNEEPIAAALAGAAFGAWRANKGIQRMAKNNRSDKTSIAQDVKQFAKGALGLPDERAKKKAPVRNVKEDVGLEEGNAENKMKKNAYADAKGAANKNLDRGSQRRVDSRRTDEVDSIKKGIDNYAPKKAAVRNIIRGKVFGKLSDTETKMFARKRVKEDVNLQELDDTTTFSYLQKRHGMKTLTHFKPENKVSAKSEKGKTNALASIEKKREAEREISRKATKKAGMGAARDYKKGTYSGD